MATPDIHPAANLFPMMDAASFAELKADIEKNGQRESVVYYRGQLLDGRNRDRACRELGIAVSECELDESEDPVLFVLSANLHRRHLKPSQLSIVAARLKWLYAEAAKGRQKASGGDKRSRKAKGKTVKENLPEPIGGQSRDAAAEVVNVSGKSVDFASAVLEHGSQQLIEAVESGEVSVSRAAKIAKSTPKPQQLSAVKEKKPEKQSKTPFDHLCVWWKKADPAARTRFRLWIDGECS